MCNNFQNNIQVNPVKIFKISIDYLSHEALHTSLDAEESREGTIIESRSKGVTSTYKIVNVTSNGIQLSEFDCAVLNAVFSIKNAGNEFTTPEIIYHTLGGGHVLTDEMHKNIMNSLERLAAVRITVDMHDAKKKLGYGIDRDKTSFTGYLMPTEHVDTKINGQPVSSIHFLKQGIILSMSDMRDQLITCDQSLLKAPIRHTQRSIALHHYLLRRTLEIKGSHEAHKSNSRVKPLRKVIAFETMLKKCGLENCSREQRRNIKKIAEIILNFFVEQNVINSYTFDVRERGKIHSIIIDFSTFS